jgi:hypothetical protein
VGPGPVWTDAENLALTGIRSPYGSARSESFFTTEQIIKAQKGRRGMALLFAVPRRIMGLEVGLDRWGKSRPHRDSIPGRFSS